MALCFLLQAFKAAAEFGVGADNVRRGALLLLDPFYTKRRWGPWGPSPWVTRHLEQRDILGYRGGLLWLPFASVAAPAAAAAAATCKKAAS